MLIKRSVDGSLFLGFDVLEQLFCVLTQRAGILINGEIKLGIQRVQLADQHAHFHLAFACRGSLLLQFPQAGNVTGGGFRAGCSGGGRICCGGLTFRNGILCAACRFGHIGKRFGIVIDRQCQRSKRSNGRNSSRTNQIHRVGIQNSVKCRGSDLCQLDRSCITGHADRHYTHCNGGSRERLHEPRILLHKICRPVKTLGSRIGQIAERRCQCITDSSLQASSRIFAHLHAALGCGIPLARFFA